MRIDRNTLVNTAHISGMEKSRDTRFLVVFKGITDRLEISRRHLVEVRKFLNSTQSIHMRRWFRSGRFMRLALLRRYNR